MGHSTRSESMKKGKELQQLNIGLTSLQLDNDKIKKIEDISHNVHTLNIYGITINISTNSLLCSEELSSNYSTFLTTLSRDPDAIVHFLMPPEDISLIETLKIKNSRDVLECANNPLWVYILPASNEPGNFFLSVLQVALFRILLRHDLFCTHASGASAGNAGILFSGESNSGKTTLVMALLTEGCKYFSDDMVLINPNTMMLLPLCSRLKPREETIFMFPEMDSEVAVTYMETEHQKRKILSVEQSFPHLWSSPCPLKYIFFPRFIPDEETVLTSVSKSDAVIQFLKTWPLYKTEPTRVIPVVSKIVKECETYSLKYGNAREAVKDVLEIIQGVHDGT